jgi:MFS superfamily sulfate permease-like transporter
MATLDPETTTIPWYQSKIIRRLALSIATQVIAATHLTQYFTDINVGILVGIAYAAWALHGRVTKPVPPVALTQAKADIANTIPTNTGDTTVPLDRARPGVKPI